MSMNLISLIGGGIAATATLAVGISTSGILAAAPENEMSAPAAGETIYVEQPVIAVPGAGSIVVPASADPILIAILPASPTEGGGSTSASEATDSTVSPDPSLPTPPEEEDDDYLDEEDGEYDDGYEGPEEGDDGGGYEGPEEGDDGGGYEGPEEGDDDGGHEDGDDD